MGGRPITCLNICCFPKDGIPLSALRAILEGAAETVDEAGAVIVGGHTVIDPELKFGLSVTGLVDPSRVLTNAGALPGQALVLTKPIGLGVVMNAARSGAASESAVAEATRTMGTLNREGAEAALRHGATAATDITGFGFSGHAYGMAKASGVALRVRFRQLPILQEALALHARGVSISKCASNRANVDAGLLVEGSIPEAALDLIHDPQTSGGLLLALPAAAADLLVSELRTGRYPAAAVIGEVVASERPRLIVEG